MAEEAKKLGPNVTYNPPEGAPEVTEVGGVPMVKGEAVNVIDILGEANGGALVKKLSANPHFKVDGGPDHEKQAKAKEAAQKKADEAKAKAEEKKREEEEKAAAEQAGAPTNQVGKAAVGKKGESLSPTADQPSADDDGNARTRRG